jgi:hypothetical protein
VELADVVERRRVVDEDVDRAELLDDSSDGRVDLHTIRDVALDRRGAAPQTLDLLRRLLRVDEPLRARHLRQDPGLRDLFGVGLDEDVRDRNVRPRTRERERVGSPQAA